MKSRKWSLILESIIKVRGKHFHIKRASKLQTANRLKRTIFNNKMKVQKIPHTFSKKVTKDVLE